jgi:hypothetical protein
MPYRVIWEGRGGGCIPLDTKAAAEAAVRVGVDLGDHDLVLDVGKGIGKGLVNLNSVGHTQ